MNVFVLIDSFKGSMTSMEAGNAVKEGVLKVHPTAKVLVRPLADGGEGTTDALTDGLGGERIDLVVTGPMGVPVQAYYGILNDKETAVMEMAQAAGITLVEAHKKNPGIATTYGVGEMIKDAIVRGCREFIIGIGGSATNDGGTGMLKALGIKFLTKEGTDAGQGANALEKIHSISMENMLPELKHCNFQIACDVTNPLYGETGATYIFGKQKGIKTEEMPRIDHDMRHFAKVTSERFGRDFSEVEGAGAAGGLGFAFISYLNAKLVPGINLILDVIQFERDLDGMDIIVTGEGRLDIQTAMGKAPVGVAKLAKKHGCKVIAFAGSVTKDAAACNEKGIDAFFPIVRGISTLEEAMDNTTARTNLTDTAEQVFRLF
ncbi:MAG: glycerate kinase [Lachnospiraceae bacterium]